MSCIAVALGALASILVTSSTPRTPRPESWQLETPLRPLPPVPLGVKASFEDLRTPRVTPRKVRLGRWLFFDARLSKDGTVSCASCHRPENGFSELTAHSKGIGGREGKRKAPPILNAAFAIKETYFWDGRARSLAEQAKGPLVNPIEMGNTHDAVVRTVARIRGYRKAFREAYGDGRIDIDRVADAIAAYEATRLSGDSRYDRFLAGDTSALTQVEKEGREVFFGRGRCDSCHGGWSFTDSKFHNIGIGWSPPPDGRPAHEGFGDTGRFAVTKHPKDLGAFKTPTLRDVSKRAPYMHDGSAATLQDAVRAYQHVSGNPNLDPIMREIEISCRDVEVLVAFLRALDGTGYDEAPPMQFPR
jgi:cytochrome c peroxidase